MPFQEREKRPQAAPSATDEGKVLQAKETERNVFMLRKGSEITLHEPALKIMRIHEQQQQQQQQ